uniref:F16G20.160 n=1 Tax=Arabidopsis thaliana TaxID=3702 RepID=Q9FPH8_ARATH|nr:F16G20.160 [Arabidopsis thaliana]
MNVLSKSFLISISYFHSDCV